MDFGRHNNILVDIPCKMELNFGTLFFVASRISLGPLVKKGHFFHHTFWVLITRMSFCSCFVSYFEVLQKKLWKQCNIFVSKFFQLRLLNLRFKLWIGKFIFEIINWILQTVRCMINKNREILTRALKHSTLEMVSFYKSLCIKCIDCLYHK